MKSYLEPDVFEELFRDELKSYREAIAVAQAEQVKAETQRQEAEEKTKAVENFFLTGMYDMIGETLCKRCNLAKVPEDVTDKLEKIRSYPFLRKLFRIANSTENRYAEFLTALEKGEE